MQHDYEYVVQDAPPPRYAAGGDDAGNGPPPAIMAVNHPPSAGMQQQFSPQDVIGKIEDLTSVILDALNKEESPILSSSLWSSTEQQQGDNVPPPAAGAAPTNTMTKRFNLAQCRVFTSIMLVLSFVHSLLLANRTTTTREVYYFYVTHFRSQKECDAAILDAANLLRVPRVSLGLTASPKGWFCGSFQILRNSSVVDGTALSSMHGLPITREWIDRSQQPVVDFHVRSNNAKCIIVVEKEGVYNRLTEDRFWGKYPCILVTGKGFPDLATRALVHCLHHELGELPVYGICDCNPFGVGVLQTYMCGSRRMGLDGGDRYSVPLQWIGLRPSHVQALKNKLPREVYQCLTDVDQRRLGKLCDETSPFLRGQHKEKRLDELLLMTALRYKVELEALHWLGMNYLSEWIEDTLIRHENRDEDDDDEESIGII